jgi:predicted Ser/Thr protein kinase
MPIPSFPGYVLDGEIRSGAFYKARIVRGRRGPDAARASEPCVIKDLSPLRAPFRVYARRMLEREARILERLHDSWVAPRLLERISRDAIAIEFVESDYLRKRIRRKPHRMARVLAAFERAVDELHRRGIAHLDLRQRKNVLVKPDDSVVLIDFESAWDLARMPLLRRLLEPLLFRIDRNAVLKWKVKFAPELATADERRRVQRYYRWKRLWIFGSPLHALTRRLSGAARPRHLKPRPPIQNQEVH